MIFKFTFSILIVPVLLFLSEAAFPLNRVTADLWLDIDSSYCETKPLRLCIGSDSKCYDITNPCGAAISQLLDYHTISSDPSDPDYVATHDDDHPFVNHPDDWDYVYIRNDSGSDFSINSASLYLTNLESADPLGNNTFVFFDWPQPPNSGRWFSGNEIVPVFDWVKEHRERLVCELFCEGCETCSNEESSEFFSSQIPWAVREQTYDLGQAGIVKYHPWSSGRSDQMGCDEACNYYSSQFTNNIHYSCKFDNNKCSYFRYWKSSGYHMTFRLEQMAHAGRLYKLDFMTAGLCPTNTPMRTGIRGAFRCIPEGDESTDDGGQPITEVCSIDPTSGSYTPKIGDLFFRVGVDASGDIRRWHAMTLIREYWYRPSSSTASATVVAPVIHKRGDIVRAEEAPQGDVNAKVGGACSEYFFNYYVGEVDHEIDPDGEGSLTSGARPNDNGTNFGFRISLIPLF